MRRIFAFLLFGVVVGALMVMPGEARAEDVNKWIKSYYTSGWDRLEAVAIAPNGDIIVVGYVDIFLPDVWVLRLDENGDIIWQKAYDEGSFDLPKAVAIASNGDIIVVGSTQKTVMSDEDLWILRLDEYGNVKWQKTYGGTYVDWASAVAIAPNGDIIVAGVYGAIWNSSEGYWTGGDFWVLRLDENGNVKWSKTYGGSDFDGASAIAITDNGDIIVVGGTTSFGSGSKDVWVLRLDENGNVKWSKTYGGSEKDRAYAVAIAPNGDIMVAGYYGGHEEDIDNDGYEELVTDLLVLRLDENGDIIWQKAYDGSSEDRAYAVAVAPNGDIIVAGSDFLWWSADGKLKWIIGFSEIDSEVTDIEVTDVEVLPNGTVVMVIRPVQVVRFPVGDAANYSCEKANLKVREGDAKVQAINAVVESPEVRIHDTHAEVYETSAHVITSAPSNATLKVSSIPYGAKVYINGNYKGITPLTLELPPGTYTIKLTMEDYEDYMTTVTLSEGDTKSISATLSPTYGYVKVDSSPPGAKVYIDGSYGGVTPVTLGLPPGTYTIKLTMEDYEDYMTIVEVESEKLKVVSVTLKPVYGFLSVESNPSGAEVYINGIYVGTTPLEEYELFPGEHEVRIKKEGYEEYSRTVAITARGKLVLSVSLAPLSAATTTISVGPTGPTTGGQEHAATTTEEENGGICGSAAFMGLVLLAGAVSRRRKRE